MEVMNRKKTGFAVICGGLIFTLGTGVALAAKPETQGAPQNIKEDIMIKTDYRFLPDPEIYARYSGYGITISDDGEMLLYKGQSVRLFVDEKSAADAFYSNGAGTVDLAVIRNASGNITAIENISEVQAQEYRNAFSGDDIETAYRAQDLAGNKYEQYAAYGITLSSDGNVLYYNGQRVKFFVDGFTMGYSEALWSDEAGTINLSVVRRSNGEIAAIEPITEEKAREYRSAQEEYEQNILNGLDEKIDKRMRELYGETE